MCTHPHVFLSFFAPTSMTACGFIFSAVAVFGFALSLSKAVSSLDPLCKCWKNGVFFQENSAREAHRQVPIDGRDWHFLGCPVEVGGDVSINTVCTFGVASAPASCYWSRVVASMTASTRRRRFPSCIEPPWSRSSCCAPQLEHPCRLQSHGHDVVGPVYGSQD